MALRFRGLDAPIEVVYRKSSGSAPQPVDPYQQAAAQYGLSTGTAEFNAGLNRTNSVNPVGSSTWAVTGYSGYPSGRDPSMTPANSPTAFGLTGKAPVQSAHDINVGSSDSGYHGTPTNVQPATNPLSYAGLTGNIPENTAIYPNGSPPPTTGTMGTPYGTGSPIYTQTTSLQPWANNELAQPIDTSGIAGMPGGPSTTQDLLDTQRSLYNQQMAYIQPQEQLANEQLNAQLANEGITRGSDAYKNAIDTQNRANTFTNNQAINSAIQGGGAEQSRLFGLGSQSLQNQLAVRNAPINEFNALQGGAGANATAQTPDISGAFNQAYQGQLAGYNANVASNNADTSAAGSLLASYLMYLALA